VVKYEAPHLRHHEQPRALVWMDVETHQILKTRRAPAFVFQEGSCVMMISEEAKPESDARPRFFARIRMEMDFEEKSEPLFLGPHIFASGGYQLHAEATLLDWGEDWQCAARPWCLLRLSKLNSFTRDGSERSCKGQTKRSI